MIRSCLVGVLKLDALSNGVPVDTVSTHSLRSGGTTTMFHSGYGLLEAKEWGRWKSSRFHVYLRYGMQTMMHVRKKMAVATGLLDFTNLKPSAKKAATFRDTGKQSTSYHPQPSLPATCTSCARDVFESLRNDIRKSIHCRWLVDSTGKTTMEDLILFDNNNAVFYARQGRLFVRELLELGGFSSSSEAIEVCR